MSKFFNSFTFKIWLPFTVALIFIIAVSAWYYPLKQEQFLLENKRGQVQELAKTVATSYELAFTDSDETQVFRRVKQIIDFAKNDHDIDYIQIYENGKIEHKFSKEGEGGEKQLNNDTYIYEDWKFNYINSEGYRINGFVRIAILKAGIEDEIFQMNYPIYMILFGIALFLSVTFYLLAGWLSRPIVRLTQSTLALSKQDFSTKLPEYSANDEIGSLIKSINELKNNLIEQKSKNDKFVFGLEELVDKRAKDLRETQAQMALAQKNAKFGTIRYSFLDDSWTSSEEFDLILGVTKKTVKNLSGLQSLYKEEEEGYLNGIWNEMISKKEKNHSSDFKLKRFSDAQVLTLNQVIEIKFKGDDPVELIGSIQDITERTKIQEEVERLSHVATKTTNLVVITDVQERIVWVNDATVKMTEYSREEIIGKTPRMFQSKNTDAKTKSYIRENLAKGNIISEVEILNQSKSGREYWLSLNIVPINDNDDNLTGYIAIESDLTDHKKQLHLIEEKEKNYRSLLDNSSEMIHSLNEAGQIKYVNSAWLENMGFKDFNEVEGRPILEFFTDDTLKEFSIVMPQLMKGEHVEDLTCEFLDKGGSVVDIKGRSKPIMVDGKFAGSEAFLFNVTSVLKTERKLVKMSEFQNLLMQISTEYINAPISEINNLINQSLSDMAGFSSADRAYVFRYNYEKEICSITHEWVGRGIPSQINELTEMPFSSVPFSLQKHKKGDFVEFPDVSKVQDKRIHAVLTEEGIQSLISIPMMDGDVAIGFIGFDIMKTKREFNSNEKNLMRLYAQMIVNVFNRMKFIEELQSTKEALSDINKSLEKKVIENTKKNIDLSRSILEQEKLVTIGEISAGIAHDLNTPLGTIRVGSDNVSYIIDKLFRDDLNGFSKNELIEIIDYVKKNKIEIYVGGLQMRKEKENIKEFLFSKYPDRNEEESMKFTDLFVKCRINESQDKLIDKLINKKNGIEYLELLNQVQMAIAQLDTIKTSSDKAVRVVQDMRAFIKGETTVERKMINLRENISTVLGVFNYEINLNVDLKFEVDESIEFMGYDIKLFQLWSNIVKNALEAMSDQEDKYFGVIAVQEEGQIKVTFENNGPEIPKEIISSIFNKFYTTKAKKSGSGLGLSIVKNVLREHRANINIESSDKMTKFIITFEI